MAQSKSEKNDISHPELPKADIVNITSLFRPVIQQFADSYHPVPGIEDISQETGIPVSDIAKLDAGENPFVHIPMIDTNMLLEKLAFYPDPIATRLREALAIDLGVSPEMITIGNGSDELIDLVCRLFLEPGRTLVDFSPTFPMYKIFAKVAGATIVDVPRDVNFQLSERSLEEVKKAHLVFIANPNNPTGTVIETEVIERLLQTGAPLVIDEAYFEFYGKTVIPLLRSYPNLIVLRTFSKWAGIAGLRIGYMIADSRVIEKANAIKPPYNTNVVAQEIAQEVLEKKNDYTDELNELIQARDQFIENINALPNWRAIPSQASCVCISSDRYTSSEICEYLKQHGILVRSINTEVLPNTLRISLAPQAIMVKLFSLLKDYKQ